MKQGFGNFLRTKIHPSSLCYVQVLSRWRWEKDWKRNRVAEETPTVLGPPAGWILMSEHHFFLTKTLPWFSHREIYQRQWEGLNIKYSGLVSKIMVAVLLTCIQANWLSVSRSLRVALGSTWKTSGYLACPCLFYFIFFCFVCSTVKQSQKTWFW